MVDPYNITNYNRTNYELEELMLFCIIVAGKKASIQSLKLEQFLSYNKNLSPFECIRQMIDKNILEYEIKKCKLGQYSKIYKSFYQIVNSNIDLKTCSSSDIERIHGIGCKTSRFFLLHSRHKYVCAVLDTHILKFMRDYLKINTPKSTPNKNNYSKFENEFLSFAYKVNMDIANLDLLIWTAYSRNNFNDLESLFPNACY